MWFSSLGPFTRSRPQQLPFCRSRWLVGTLLLVLSSVCLAEDQSAKDQSQAPDAKPSVLMDVSQLGFPQLSRTERLVEDANVTLDFIDENHVLLTFNPKKLFAREAACPPGHDDRLVRAFVLEIPSGNVVAQTEWYLHDHRHYLWSLGSGNFLLRRMNSLYLVDASLHERLLWQSPKDLLWVSVTPDRKQILVESADDVPVVTKDSSDKDSATQEASAKPGFILQFLDRDSLRPQRTLRLTVQVNLDVTSTGYADTVHKGDLWLVRYGTSPEERRNIARVRSRGIPRIFYSSNNSLLIGRCCSANGDYSVTAFTLTGHRLWRQHWAQNRYFPVVANNAGNSRAAISTLSHTPYAASTANAGVDSANDNTNYALEQTVQVLETASGSSVRTIDVSPVIMSEQNYALSPQGRRLATLTDTAVAIYDLPPISAEEEAKFAAIKADVPGLYTLPSENEVPEGGTVASNENAPAPKPDVAAASPAIAPITNAGEDAAPIPTFKSSAQAVALDVVVTDAQGHPVRGLTQHDFQLNEDGEPQQVRSFREVATTDNQQSATPPSAKGPNVFSNSAGPKDSGSIVMVLFDQLNTPSQDQLYARQQLVKFLSTRPEGAKKAQFALCTLSGDPNSHLRLIQGFTADENELLKAANRKDLSKPVGWQMAQEGRQNAINNVKALSQGDMSNSWGGLLTGLQAIQTEEQANDSDTRVAITLDVMMQLARYLSGIPGRKNLVWLSGSFPISLYNPDLQNPASTNRNYNVLVKQTARQLAESQVAVYPVDVRGLDAGKFTAADNVGIAPGNSEVAVQAGLPTGRTSLFISPYSDFQQNTLQELALQNAERSAINAIATQTGGTAFFSSNAIAEAISTATEQGANYYALSYSPSNKNYDGHFRKIKIALAQKGYHLHYRPGYFASDPNQPGREKEISHKIRVVAMQHGSPQSRQIRFSVRVVPIGPRTKVDGATIGEILLASAKKPTLPSQVEVQHHAIDYAIDSSDLRFLSLTNGKYRSALTFMVASFSADGRPLAGVSTIGTSELQPDAYKDVLTGGVRVHQEVDVPIAAASLRIGIQDQLSNYVGTVDIALPVSAPPDVPRMVKNQLPEIEPD